jgi:prepilin-type N-terminal cleavage/methylation domain-containing protein
MNRGFTLIEIVVTLTIAALAAAVAVPALSAVLDRTPSASASAVELLDRARRTAAEQGTRVTVVVIPATARYWVWANRDEGRATLSEGVLALAAGAHFEPTSDRVTIAFDPYGAASGDTLVVRTAGRTELVAADRWTGEVHVAQP